MLSLCLRLGQYEEMHNMLNQSSIQFLNQHFTAVGQILQQLHRFRESQLLSESLIRHIERKKIGLSLRKGNSLQKQIKMHSRLLAYTKQELKLQREEVRNAKGFLAFRE